MGLITPKKVNYELLFIKTVTQHNHLYIEEEKNGSLKPDQPRSTWNFADELLNISMYNPWS